MGLLVKILKNFRVVDYLVIIYCTFGMVYGAFYYKAFEEGRVLSPSRYVVTAYHQSKGADTFDKMVELGIKEGHYKEGKTPVQKEVKFSFIARFFGIIIAITFFFRLILAPSNAVFKFFREWYPYFVVPVCLYSVGWLNQVHFDALPYDDDLHAIDVWLFNSVPAIDFFKSVPNFWLEEFLNLSYFNFYYMGFMIGIPVYITRTQREFNFFLAIYILGFISNFALSILVPAAGPIFHYTDGIRFPYYVQGEIVRDGIGPITRLMRNLILDGEIPAGAMPSSHCSIAFIAAIFGFKYFGRWGYFYLFWSASLWVSTVYLQQHYLIDVFAGLFMAYPVYYFLGRYFYRLVERKSAHWINILEKKESEIYPTEGEAG